MFYSLGRHASATALLKMIVDAAWRCDRVIALCPELPVLYISRMEVVGHGDTQDKAKSSCSSCY